MNVYLYFYPQPDVDSTRADFIRLWASSWSRHGWTPRILTIRDARKSSYYRKALQLDLSGGFGFPVEYLALHAVGGGMLTTPDTINFGLPAKRRVMPAEFISGGVVWSTSAGIESEMRRIARYKMPGSGFMKRAPEAICGHYPAEGWQNYPLVRFVGGTPEDIRTCGRDV